MVPNRNRRPVRLVTSPTTGSLDSQGRAGTGRGDNLIMVSRAGSIGMVTLGVAADFAAQRAGGPSQESRKLAQRLPLSQPQTQSFTFDITDVRVAFLWHCNTLVQ